MLSFLLTIAAFAFFYRCTGGFIGMGEGRTNLARLVWWALPVSLAFMNPLCGLMAWAGRHIPHGWAQNVADRKEVIGMNAIGLARAFLILLPLAPNDWWILGWSLIGAYHGVLYQLGLMLKGRDSGFYFRGDRFAGQDTEWCEVFVGASFGLMVALVGVFHPEVFGLGGFRWVAEVWSWLLT